MFNGDKVISKMVILRWLLTAFTLLAWGYFIYGFTFYHTDRRNLWVMITIFVFLWFNLLYLLLHRTQPNPGPRWFRRMLGGPGPGRFRRMLRLWLDAKEAELRRRVGRVDNAQTDGGASGE